MATAPPPAETPKLGIRATIFGLVFALAVLGGFGVATAASYEDDHGSHSDVSDTHDESDGHDSHDGDHAEEDDHDDE